MPIQRWGWSGNNRIRGHVLPRRPRRLLFGPVYHGSTRGSAAEISPGVFLGDSGELDPVLGRELRSDAKVEAQTNAEAISKPSLKPITIPNNAIVEFTAYYFENKSMYQLHETSNFSVEDGKWRYHDGVLHDDCGKIKYGRNLPCVCGSNKKFKQCCATKSR